MSEFSAWDAGFEETLHNFRRDAEFMKRKNILAILLALVMALNFSVTAFAAPTAPTPTDNPMNWDTGKENASASVTLKGLIYVPTIKVTLGSAQDVIVNPYNLKFRPTGATSDVTESVIGAPGLITSESDVKLTIKAQPTITSKGSGVSIASSPTEAQAGGKKIFLFLELQEGDNSTDTKLPSGSNWMLGTAFTTKTASTAVFKENTASLDTATLTLGAAAVGSPKYAAFNIAGVSGKPADSETPWDSSADQIGLNVVFTFAPDLTTP